MIWLLVRGHQTGMEWGLAHYALPAWSQLSCRGYQQTEIKARLLLQQNEQFLSEEK